MTEWGVALLAAGSALAGSLVTGWFARSAGNRQAEAARHAGDRQADALLDTVRTTLQDQRDVRLLDLRRQTYAAFLEAAEAVLLTHRTGEGGSADRSALQRALATVLLEGPEEVADAARVLVTALGTGRAPDELVAAREDFLHRAREALNSARPLQGY
ncbi:hypothetical protein [Streptomyces oceani]|uniref:Uncharacterized protein n=1 Tax=Streptomyces oceani TaxID=1075402 RepID=A0A1E7KMM2_9ACTN|nr:hypothetical protein [Streptomyces oceani]OEV05195.1 hypothetical protein AN216_04285 [Streptomyces oceani]